MMSEGDGRHSALLIPLLPFAAKRTVEQLAIIAELRARPCMKWKKLHVSQIGP
jgi:hypothetical protein